MFSGQEARAISKKDLLNAVEILKKDLPPCDQLLDHITQNCSLEQVELLFGKITEEGYAASVLYGVPVYKRRYMPLGELWFIAQDGSVLGKYKID